ncbi:pyrroline-5-carboxylate reductase [Helicobacter mustelae]|uniref:Pyrroline-5-carboxylate reductase n=1 Tax=Helicobacter mustelae (strain ATCC 43772 / CCUG 25715 / CIP 103759 / LMG 18044 / NCTC 12198 / R85-136P) TaxID=679897 RepID=D3UGD8_HELM1|nr:pyrroline-5-carboxylate reductase [Helicobacter mustelae]CBG39559.1 putative pyrroline-5-carboxylate reductase [Helicobacter mustelae 12198]SQH71071.1 pyrroline-5-carboxylate reductase [Helicobacter mustelae]
MTRVLVIGHGKIALTLIEGILKAGLHNKYYFEICGREFKKVETFIKFHHLESHFHALPPTPPLFIDEAIVFLCTKPQGLESFVFGGKARAVVSVMAGVSIAKIQQSIHAIGYARIMPNIAAKYQKSCSALYCKDLDWESIGDLVQSFGKVVVVEKEELIDASIAVSGSAPAFLALIAQALMDAGVREGLARLQSKEFVRGMFEGFALLLQQQDPQEIMDLVASPGGTTIEGLSVLESRGVRGAIMEACHQAVARAKKL